MKRGAAIAALAVALALGVPVVAEAELPRSGTLSWWPVAATPGGEILSVDGIDPDLFYRVTPPGGAFGSRRRLSTDGVDPDVVYGPHGEALVAWSMSAGPKYGPTAAYRPAGGAFQAPVSLAKPGYPRPELYNIPSPDAAFDGAGVATAVWASLGGQIVSRSRSVAGRWSAPEKIADGGMASRPRLVVLPSGAATVTWDQPGPKRGQDQVLVATRPAGGSFGAPTRLVANGDAPGNEVIAANDRGDTIVIWVQDHEEGRADPTSSLYGAIRSGSAGTFSAPIRLAPRDQNPSWGSASVAPDGAMVIAWTGNGSKDRIVGARMRTADGRLLAPQILSRRHAMNTEPTALALGSGIVGWFSGIGDDPSHPGNSPTRLQTASGTPAGTFGHAKTRYTTSTGYTRTPFLFSTDTGLLVVSPRGRVLTARG